MSQKTLQEIERLLSAYYGTQVRGEPVATLESIVSAVLSQNSTPKKLELSLTQLKNAGVLSPESFSGISLLRLAELIQASGQANLKARRLKSFFAFLEDRHGASFERMQAASTRALREEMLALSGIGPETADRILLLGLGRPVFPVNQAAYRVFFRHYLLEEDADYERAREVAEHFSGDAQMYRSFHELLGKVGKEFCGPVAKCEACPLNGVNW